MLDETAVNSSMNLQQNTAWINSPPPPPPADDADADESVSQIQCVINISLNFEAYFELKKEEYS